MAKRKKNRSRGIVNPLAGLITADLISDILGNLVGQFLAGRSERLLGQAQSGKKLTEARVKDPGLKLLALIEEKETIYIPKLLRRSRMPLLETLTALSRLLEFKLIEIEDQTVRLTRDGAETLGRLRLDADKAKEEIAGERAA